MWFLYFIYQFLIPQEYIYQEQKRYYYKWFPFLSWKKSEEESDELIVEVEEDTINEPEYTI